MARTVASRTWVCERDDQDADSPFCARLLVEDDPVASARGVDELTAFARLAETVSTQGIPEGRVLGMVALMRLWDEYNRRSKKR